MSVKLGLEWFGFDMTVTIIDYDKEDLSPLSGVVEMDGTFDTDSPQDRFLRHINVWVKANNDYIFDELFQVTENIDKSYTLINDHLKEDEADSKLDRDIEEWDRSIDR